MKAPYRPHDCGGCREIGVSTMIDGTWAHRWESGKVSACLAAAPSQRIVARSEVRRVITNAYYDCRNEGLTMETAADRAADAVMALLATA